MVEELVEGNVSFRVRLRYDRLKRIYLAYTAFHWAEDGDSYAAFRSSGFLAFILRYLELTRKSLQNRLSLLTSLATLAVSQLDDADIDSCHHAMQRGMAASERNFDRWNSGW